MACSAEFLEKSEERPEVESSATLANADAFAAADCLGSSFMRSPVIVIAALLAASPAIAQSPVVGKNAAGPGGLGGTYTGNPPAIAARHAARVDTADLRLLG
jgi:hypothetical protein